MEAAVRCVVEAAAAAGLDVEIWREDGAVILRCLECRAEVAIPAALAPFVEAIPHEH